MRRRGYTGPRATPELVGREDALRQIAEAFGDREHDYVVHISGKGGIGKTCLVQHVLRNPPADGSPLVASEILDLYHTRVHTIEGFTLALQQILSPEGKGFESFRKEHETLISFLVTEPPPGTDVHQQRLRVGQAFVEDLNRLSQQKRVVLALDTAERLFPLADPAAKPLGLVEEYPDILEWLLCTFLPQTKNVVVLLAGRPGPGNLEELLTQVKGKQMVSIPLVGLNFDETNRYFDAVADAAWKAQDHVTAERIRGLDARHREAIYRALCDYDEQDQELGVRPILLSLVIDHLAVSGRPSPALRQLLRQPTGAVDFTQVRQQIEADLVSEFMNIPRPANDAICALVWLRKGADAALLARVADLRKPDNSWEWDEEQAEIWLQSIWDLSFVKIRPGDRRVFLHDEMYDLFQRHVLDTPTYRSQKERIFNAVTDYYKKRIEASRHEIARLYAPQAERKFPDVEAFVQQRIVLLDALVEDLHYALRAGLRDGFDRYLLYAEEAIAANDESLDMQLRAELLGTLAQERTYAVNERKRAPDETTCQRWEERVQAIDQLHREAVVPDAAVRWVKRLTQRSRYRAALDIAEHLRSDAARLVEPGGTVVQADLAAWEGAIRAYQGDYEGAERAVQEALQKVEEASHLSRTWERIVWGRVYNNLGYVARSQGQVLRAVKAYTDALPYWRALGLAIEQANTLNNLAYTLALQGKFGEARRQGRDALGLREHLGPQPPVVLSLSTLAEIEILAGQYYQAEVYAKRALGLAESIEFERGKGFARLALAALHRFLADPEETEDLGERQRLLDAALQHSQEALQIFEALGEWEGHFRALYEKAIALREQCRLASEGGYPEWTETQKRRKAAESEEAFQEAADEARQHKRWDLYLDSLMGQAWLFYYQQVEGLEERLDSLFQEIKEHLPDYLIEPTRWPGVGESTILGVFAQLGRYHILRGILALDHAEAARGGEKKADYLRRAGGQFALAFEYDRHIGEDFRDLQRGIMVVYSRLRKFNVPELLTVFDGVKQAWGQRIPKEGGAGNVQKAEDLLFYRILEEHFGTHETLQQLAN